MQEWEACGHLPPECFRRLGKAGLFRDRWAHGRSEGLVLAVTLADELSLVSGGLGLAVTLHSEVFLGLLQRLASTNEQRALLEGGFDGSAIGCFAVTEPSGGSDVSGVRTTAQRIDNGWHISGEKRFISNAGRATHAIMLARTETTSRRQGLSLFVIPLQDEQVHIVGFYPKMGALSCDAAHIVIDGVFDEWSLLGRKGIGLLLLMEVLQYERLAVAAQLVAAARESLGLAAAWARRREVSGKALIEMQAIRHRLADALAEFRCIQAMLYSVMQFAIAGSDVARETAALKLRAARMAQHVVDESLQVLGGRGYTANYPLERHYRDIRLARIGAGTDEVMRELIAAELDRPDARFDALLAELDAEDVARLT